MATKCVSIAQQHLLIPKHVKLEVNSSRGCFVRDEILSSRRVHYLLVRYFNILNKQQGSKSSLTSIKQEVQLARLINNNKRNCPVLIVIGISASGMSTKTNGYTQCSIFTTSNIIFAYSIYIIRSDAFSICILNRSELDNVIKFYIYISLVLKFVRFWR